MMRLTPMIGGLALAACATDATSTTTTASVQPQLSSLQAGIFSKRCANAGCHTAPGAAAGLDLSDGKTWAAVVDKDAKLAQPHAWKLVVPGKSADSLLYQIVATPDSKVGTTPRMPMGDTLTAAEIAAIQAWIDQGAANN